MFLIVFIIVILRKIDFNIVIIPNIGLLVVVFRSFMNIRIFGKNLLFGIVINYY